MRNGPPISRKGRTSWALQVAPGGPMQEITVRVLARAILARTCVSTEPSREKVALANSKYDDLSHLQSGTESEPVGRRDDGDRPVELPSCTQVRGTSVGLALRSLFTSSGLTPSPTSRIH
jgi:hypothetical protein